MKLLEVIEYTIVKDDANGELYNTKIKIEYDGKPDTIYYTARRNSQGMSNEIIKYIEDNNIPASKPKKTSNSEIKKQLELAVRLQRTSLLAETDWSQLVDVPEETKAKWASYRQELRDITDQKEFPTKITWPTKPV